MLKATPRTPGTRQAKKLRLQGRIPVSVQGEGKPHLDLSIEEREFMAARRRHEHLFDLEVEGGETETALIRELQWDVTVERILHVEFRRVVRGQKTEVEVELVFEGIPKGGVTNHLATHITVMSLPSQIPDGITVKMSEVVAGETVHAKDLELPEGIDLACDPEMSIANVVVPQEDTPDEDEGEEGAEPAEAAPAAE